jgi:hypothetical protein
MKRFLLWSFERGSKQYDVICALILAFIFLTPHSIFHDRPDYMRIPSGEYVYRSVDESGNGFFTVKVDSPGFTPLDIVEKQAVGRLKDTLHAQFSVKYAEPVYDISGGLVAYSIWID